MSSPTDLEGRYHLFSIQVFAEAMVAMARVIQHPQDSSHRNSLVLKLEEMLAAVERRPRQVLTHQQRLVALRAMELLAVADESVNGPDTTEGRAKLYTLVNELKGISNQ